MSYASIDAVLLCGSVARGDAGPPATVRGLVQTYCAPDADVLEPSRREVIVNTSRDALASVHFRERARREDPFVERGTAGDPSPSPKPARLYFFHTMPWTEAYRKAPAYF